MSPKRPVMAESVGEGRWWNVTKLPTGEIELRLDPRKYRAPLKWELGLAAVGIGFSAWALRSVAPALALPSTVVSLALTARRVFRRQPTRWLMSPGCAVLEDRHGRQHRYVPARVILMRKEHPDWSEEGRTFHRSTHTSYALFVETVEGKKVAVHRGLPSGARAELAREMAGALRVEMVEREWFGVHFGPLIING